MVVDVASIHREHLARHPLVAPVSPLAVFKEAFTSGSHGHLVRCGAIGARLHLSFDADAECVGGFLVWEMPALPNATTVGGSRIALALLL
jgi:hypothetical protein